MNVTITEKVKYVIPLIRLNISNEEFNTLNEEDLNDLIIERFYDIINPFDYYLDSCILDIKTD